MINLDEQDQGIKINLDTQNNPSALQTLPADQVEDRSAVANIGLTNTTGISQQEFKDAIASGQENTIRQKAASIINNVKINWAKDMITKYPQLDDTTLKTMLAAQDPKSVFEEHYSKAYMDYLNWPKQEDKKDNWAWTVADTHPEAWDYVKQVGMESLAKGLYANYKFQDAYGHETWKDAAYGVVKDVATLGLRGEFGMRPVSTGDFFLGNALDDQAAKLWQLPFPEFKSEVDRITSTMAPDMATRWLQAMLGQSHSEKLANNVSTAMNATIGAQIGAPLAKAAVSAAFATAPIRTMARAAASMTIPRPTTIPPTVAAPALAGNLEQSAINRVTIKSINEISGQNNPIQDLKNSMTSNVNVLNTEIGANPGDLGREAANRLIDYNNAHHETFLSKIMDDLTKRGDRTPNIMNYLKEVKKGLADMFRGPDHTVLNISDPIIVPGLNVRLFNVPIGTYDGGLFGSIEEAKAFARRQGWPVKGDYDVLPEQWSGITSKEARIRGFRTQAGRALTDEGKATANAQADKLQAELDKLPKHSTGISVEGQDGWWDSTRPFYSGPIGPVRPKGPVKEIPQAQAKPKGSEWAKGTWSNKDTDLPVEISPEPPNKGPDGKLYQKVRNPKDGVESYVPYDEIKKESTNLPPVPEGHIRFYHGGNDPTSGDSRWVSPHMQYARDYRKGVGLHYVDIPKSDLAEGGIAESGFDHTNNFPINFNAPESIAKKLKPVPSEETFEQWMERTGKEPFLQSTEKEPSKTKAPSTRSISGRFMSAKDSIADNLVEQGAYANKEEALKALEDAKWWEKLTPAQREAYLKEDEPKAAPRPKKQEPQHIESESHMIQQGNGFYINHVVYLPEEMDFVRDGLINSPIGGLTLADLRDRLNLSKVSTGLVNESWAGGWANWLLGPWRSPAERLSAAENINRLITTHGPSVLLGVYEDGSKPIDTIPRKFQADFNRLINYLQKATSEDSGVPGMWFNSPFDVQDWYLRNIKRAPDETELKAYFAYRSLMLDDLNMRNIAVMQRKLVMGAKQWAVTYTDSSGKPVTIPFFEGVERQNFPDHGTVLYVKDGLPDGSKWGRPHHFDANFRQSVEEDVAQGKAKIIQVFSPKDKPLKDLKDRSVDYIISYNSQQKPIGYNHVNQVGGGHMIPQWGYFLKQANIESHFFPNKPDTSTIASDNITGFRNYLGTPSTATEGEAYHVYHGDGTLLNFRTKADAEAAVPALERVRQLLSNHVKLQSGDAEAIQRWENEGGAVVPDWYQQAADEARHSGIPFDKLKEWWAGPNAPFNVHQPIKVVPMGDKIIDQPNAFQFKDKMGVWTDQYPGLIDATKDGSLLGKAMIGFTQERDMQGLLTLASKGTESAPAYAFEPAPLVDPITAMERGYGGVVKSLFMYDMKKYSMEHWLEQAKDYLKTDQGAIRDNPMFYFYNHPYIESSDPVVQQIIQRLETNRQMAADFVGIGDRTTNTLQMMGQTLSDLMTKKGQRQVEALYDLPKQTDYAQWIRNVAFYSSQISLKTFFTQASTLSNIYFIAGPQQASKATAAMMMYGWWNIASRKPEILEGLDRALARYMGWQPGRFTEAVHMMEGAGLHTAAGEHAFKQGMTGAGLQAAEEATPISLGFKTVSNFGRTILDYGSLPFNLGSATTRRAAFFTAYLEGLEKAPGGIIDRTLSDAMLSRASLLDSNMSTAMNTRLNKGLMSIPFQFMTFDKNMTEMFWGKQLTRNEKLSLFASSSVMFGLRGGFYAAVGLPIANYVLGKTETALGYVPGENPLYDMVVNGFPSWMFHILSGGPFIDFARWGNRGIQALEDFIDSDKSMLELAAGAAGGVFAQTWQNTWGIRAALIDSFKPGGYRMTSQDVLQMFKTLTAVQDINQARLALDTGKLLTRNDTYVTDIGPVMAMIKGITGLQPIAASDVWIKQKELAAMNDNFKIYQRHVSQEIMRMAIAGQNGDPDTATLHLKNARNRLALLPPEKWNQSIREAFTAIGFSMERRVDYKLFRDNPEQLIRNFQGM